MLDEGWGSQSLLDVQTAVKCVHAFCIGKYHVDIIIFFYICIVNLIVGHAINIPSI